VVDVTLPGLFMVLTVMTLNILGEALRDATTVADKPMTPPLSRSRSEDVTFYTEAGVGSRRRMALSFDIGAGEPLSIVGESGCGKSVTRALDFKADTQPPGRHRARSRIEFEGTGHRTLATKRSATSRQSHLDDLPGADVRAKPRLHRRRSGR